MSAGLTTQQANLLDFLKSTPRTPSYAEMARALNIKSKSMIFRLIEGLETRGYIERLPNKSRAVRLVAEPKPWTDMGIPITELRTSALIEELARRGVKVVA
jgi:SOS-response transcriptional repressor LexA